MKKPRVGKILVATEAHSKIFVVQKFKRPGRKPFTWAFLRTEIRPTVVVFPITSGHKVLAVNIFRYAANTWVTELPGGGQKKGQTLKDTAIDELETETGYTCDKKHLVQLSAQSLYFEPAAMTARYIPFLAVDCHKLQKEHRKQKREKEEVIREVKEISITNWLRRVKSGKILDDKSLAITLLALLHLNSKTKA